MTQQLNVQSNHTFAKIGLPAPNFSLAFHEKYGTLEEKISLEDYRGRWLVFFFWPFDFTFVCPTEITAFSDHYEAVP